MHLLPAASLYSWVTISNPLPLRQRGCVRLSLPRMLATHNILPLNLPPTPIILAQPALFVPAHRECEVVVAALDAVLSLQVCHELCALTIDGLDQVSRAQSSQCSLAASMDLWVDKPDSWALVIMWPCCKVLLLPCPLRTWSVWPWCQHNLCWASQDTG